MKSTLNFKFLLLYIPYLVSISIAQPESAYLAAWIGSFFIFVISMSGIVKPLPTDLPFLQQVLRPLFFLQVIFCGYMACSSIFFFLDSMGYTYFDATSQSISLTSSINSIAWCQQYYVLGHAAFVHGLLLVMKYPVKVKTRLHINNEEVFFVIVSIVSLPLSYILKILPGLNQFSIPIATLSYIAGTFALSKALANKNSKITAIALLIFLANFAKAALSGSKEAIIVSVLLLGIFLLPVYGKKILVVFIPVMIFIFLVVPTFVGTLRESSSFQLGNVDAAQKEALEAVKTSETIAATNWLFLVHRLSEVSMFVQYTQFVPTLHKYYGTQILEQALTGLLPRALWPTKPDMEVLTMERVYKAGVIDPTSYVSAKPATVVDAYLSGGSFGVWISLFVYGLISQLIAIQSEKLFGGFILGITIFLSFFKMLWLGNCFEFLINSIFWAYIGMYIFYLLLKKLNIVKDVDGQ